MKLNRRGQYSLKALLDLSLQKQLGPTATKAIAQRQKIPAPYLEKLFIQMRHAGLVESVRGAQGGYQLAKPPAQISLGHILEAVGETIEPDLNLKKCRDEKFRVSTAEDWVTFTLWNRLRQILKESLYSISLEDLYYDARSWQASQGQDTNFII